MPPRPQRSGRWSLRQVSLEAGVTLATARAVVRNGHLDPTALTARDVLVLRVAAMLPALQPFGEQRPANAPREVPARELTALQLVRGLGADVPQIATLVVTADTACLALTFTEVSAETLKAAEAGLPYLALPIGRWALDISQNATEEAA